MRLILTKEIYKESTIKQRKNKHKNFQKCLTFLVTPLALAIISKDCFRSDVSICLLVIFSANFTVRILLVIASSFN